jgi:hypothetical protein
MENKKAEACGLEFPEFPELAPRHATRRRAVWAVCDSISHASHRRRSFLRAAGILPEPQDGPTPSAPGPPRVPHRAR